ncbi:MAG: hypothetical protein ACJ78Q_04390 [Chloroflexia bacterium]
MTLSIAAKRVGVATLSLAVLAPMLATSAPTAQARTSRLADPALEEVWNRTDKPIEDRVAARSWTWGPDTFYTNYEPYAEGLGGRHLVTYFDKSRMEINDPTANRNAQWFVTNGLLVVEMISGQVQMGNNSFSPATPAQQPVAGDVPGSPDTPTYASLSHVASLRGDNRASNRTSQSIREGLGRAGGVANLDNLSGFARYAVYEPTTGHNIPDVFWRFLKQKGLVYQNGRYAEDTIVDWLFAMGYPITEPYWVKISVSGQERWVLMQAFQRRILTYSPYNPQGWQVEMGNVGRAYYEWRYNQVAPSPTPTPVAAASISINPASGTTHTSITISGKGFPASQAVALGIEKPAANYFRSLTTIAANSGGAFTAKIAVPTDSAKLGEVTITATANRGAVRATQTYRFNYSPTITLNTVEVVSNGALRVQGDGFPSLTNVKLGALFNETDIQWLADAKTGDTGAFNASMKIGNRTPGSTFKVVALADGGYKAISATVRVLGQPGLQVMPAAGPAGQNVTLYGYGWPANRAVSLGLRAAQDTGEAWLTNPVATDGAGNFSTIVFVGPQYAGKGLIYLVAFDSASLVRAEAVYSVTGAPPPTATPVPLQPTVQIDPVVLAIGQAATVIGANWQAGGAISIGVGRPGFGVEEWLTVAAGDGNRSFRTAITLGPRWQNAGQLVLTAIIPNLKSATTDFWVTGPRITPSGLPLTVTSYTHKGATQYKLAAEGWQPGEQVTISVVSVDGTLNIPVSTAIVGAEGKLGATFPASAPWAGRPDLGVRVANAGGQHYSIRYLPLTGIDKISNANNTYTLTGFNWPANTQIRALVYGEDDAKGDGALLKTLVTDTNGSFTFTIDMPRIPGSVDNDLELHADDPEYNATFDL